MPKRPCSIAITEDGTTLLCADKFGDVYSLPLSPSGGGAAEDAAPSTPATPAAAPPRPERKGANALTVHSQRNLRALENQRLHRGGDAPKEGPAFEHELLLGHVSMLTAVAAVAVAGRRYILTADRDEHIRVSRGAPQAPVVDAYCLGHRAFISCLCLPPTRPDLLVSGGGDDALLVWDWRPGRLLERVPLLPHVRHVVPAADRIAVSGLHAYAMPRGAEPAAAAVHVVAICER